MNNMELNKKTKIGKLMFIFWAVFFTLIFVSENVSAHCPLCTIGAAAAAGGAVWLGVNKMVVSLFIGAFAVSMGWWVSKLVKKKYIPFQKAVIILISFLLTVLPILPIITYAKPIFISLAGDYGSLLNRTYLVDLSLIGSLIGGIVVSLAPGISSRLSNIRKGRKIPYQGIIVTFLSLITVALIIQFIA